MEVMHRCCSGLDVHKETVVACVRRTDQDGRVGEEVGIFNATTAGLLELGDWLVERRVTIAAMESTGVYWKPVWNLLEGRLELMLVNAREVKQLPGRKTDVKDSQWIAQLLSCRSTQAELRSAAAAAGIAGSDPDAGQPLARQIACGQPPSEDSGGRQH